MGAGIVGYEILCEDEQLLSVIVDEWLVSHPVVTRFTIAAVALHLINALPPAIDPVSQQFILWRKLYRLCKR
jgi:hypothetical protein